MQNGLVWHKAAKPLLESSHIKMRKKRRNLSQETTLLREKCF